MGKFDSVIVHYAEIGIKGRNRKYFEDLLIDNIVSKLGKLAKSVRRETGQITVMLDDRAEHEAVKDVLTKVPGVAYFSFAKRCSLDVEKLKEGVLEFLEGLEFSTFKVNACRHHKAYKMTSSEINVMLGDLIIEKRRKKVKLENPDLELKVEVSDKFIYLSCGPVEGIGGLPVNPRQKVVALLSGGFDSPVAACMMMKRGCEVILVHFQNKGQITSSVEGKIVDLAKQLSKFQMKTVLYIIPFEEIQKEIIMKAKAEVRMLVYRRFMLRIASEIAKRNGARFLVTGDSLSQVSSQTIENLEATYKDSGMLILSPLIGLNKIEIMEVAKKIGTYSISEQPYPDCCSYFLPKHPELKASAGLLKVIESEFDVDKLVTNAVENARKEEF